MLDRPFTQLCILGTISLLLLKKKKNFLKGQSQDRQHQIHLGTSYQCKSSIPSRPAKLETLGVVWQALQKILKHAQV